jgi:hypothetical protein
MNDLAIIPFAEIERMAERMARSNMFGKTPDQMVALMMIAQAEGQHPAIAAMEYDVIQGRPALKSQAALARFQTSGGKIDWKERSEKAAEAVFIHPSGGSLTVRFTIERAAQMGLTGKDNWKKQPAIMLQWRCVAEGIRACYPACLNRMYLVEEVQDFEPMRNVTASEPEPTQAIVDTSVEAPELAAIKALASELGIDAETKKRLWIIFDGDLGQILGKLENMKAKQESEPKEPKLEKSLV